MACNIYKPRYMFSVQQILEVLTRLESRNLPFGHKHRFASLGVYTLPSRPIYRCKGPKPNDLNLIAIHQSLFHYLNKGSDTTSGNGLVDPRLFSHFFNKFWFVQRNHPLKYVIYFSVRLYNTIFFSKNGITITKNMKFLYQTCITLS